jgi:hypothetical protein
MPGRVPAKAPAPEGRLTDSLSLRGEPVSLQEHSPLLRKSEPSMMLSLIANVCFRLLNQRRADTRRGIPRLPLERSIAEISVAPFRRSRLDELHRLRQRHSGRKSEHDMSMIVKATDRDGHNSVCASNARHERPEAWLHLGRNDPGSILRAKDAMYSIGDVRVRHEREDSTSTVPSGTVDSTYAFPAFRLGLPSRQAGAACRAWYNRRSAAWGRSEPGTRSKPKV